MFRDAWEEWFSKLLQAEPKLLTGSYEKSKGEDCASASAASAKPAIDVSRILDEIATGKKDELGDILGLHSRSSDWESDWYLTHRDLVEECSGEKRETEERSQDVSD